MKGFKEPDFRDRAATSEKAKTSALAKLMAAPKRDQADQAARAARQQDREAKQEVKRAAQREAREQAGREKQTRRDQAAQESAKATVLVPTEAERKAARDERYAARKRRQS